MSTAAPTPTALPTDNGGGRSFWDVVLGLLLVGAGLVILSNAVFATVFSVLLAGWITLVSGVVTLLLALTRIGRAGFFATALTGALLLVLGLVMVRNPLTSVVMLTLLAGTVFLTGGIVRIIASFERRPGRWWLLFAGIVSFILGVVVFSNLWEASFVLLGTLLGIEVVMDGILLAIGGRQALSRSGATR